MPSRKSTAYFIGIGGIGMSALARFFSSQGWRVEGSDLSPSPLLSELKREGIRVYLGHKAKRISKKLGMVIYNNAIAWDNPELKRARHLKLPCHSYPEVIGEITKQLTTIAISGSHGKSTTTALLGLMLAAGKYDPTVILGTKLKEFGNKNFRKGKKSYFILEADEFKQSFLKYHPYAAIVTNIDREHLDTYRDLEGIKKAFLKFLSNVNPRGFLVLNKDDENIRSLKDEIKHKKIYWVSAEAHSQEVEAVKNSIRIAGAHNLSNALLAFKAALVLGVPKDKCLKALRAYRGSWRRMEYKGSFLGAKVYDDYAHHPTEIRATIQAAREAHPGKKLWVVFEPHQEKRLKLLFEEFSKAFEGLDGLVLLDVYRVAGRDKKLPVLSSQLLADAVRYSGRSPRQVIYLSNPEKLPATLKINICRFDKLSNAVIIMMGAGNIYRYTELLTKSK